MNYTQLSKGALVVKFAERCCWEVLGTAPHRKFAEGGFYLVNTIMTSDCIISAEGDLILANNVSLQFYYPVQPY